MQDIDVGILLLHGSGVGARIFGEACAVRRVVLTDIDATGCTSNGS